MFKLKTPIIKMLLCASIIASLTACSSHTHVTDNWESNNTEHWKICSECGKKTETAVHTADADWDCNSKEHWKICNVCGGKTDVSEHRLNGSDMCSICGSMVRIYEEDTYVEVYNSKGMISRNYDADGNLINETNYECEFDASGNLIKSSSYSDGVLIDETESTVINGESVVSKSTLYCDDGTVCHTLFDEKGKAINEKWYLNGAPTQESIYGTTENEYGMYYYLETLIYYNEDGGKSVTVYDENEKIISVTNYTADGSIAE